MRAILSLFALSAALTPIAGAEAQSLSTVPSADIPAGERLIDYRAGYALTDDGRSGAFGQRFHYQHSLSDGWRLRAIITQAERPDGVLKTQNVILHVHYQFLESEKSGGLDSAVRFDGFIPIDDRPGRARFVWLNAFEPDARWQVRADFFVARDFGNRAQEGLLIETREEASFALSERIRFGAQLFNIYGWTSGFGSFDEQRHQIGAFLRTKPTRRLGVEAGALLGLSRAAPDADFRIILTYGF
jgi:hypothetical protein